MKARQTKASSELSAFQQFLKDLHEDADYILFKARSIWRDEHGFKHSFRTPNVLKFNSQISPVNQD